VASTPEGALHAEIGVRGDRYRISVTFWAQISFARNGYGIRKARFFKRFWLPEPHRSPAVTLLARPRPSSLHGAVTLEIWGVVTETCDQGFHRRAPDLVTVHAALTGMETYGGAAER
jgi:hypothetical protein